MSPPIRDDGMAWSCPRCGGIRRIGPFTLPFQKTACRFCGYAGPGGKRVWYPSEA